LRGAQGWQLITSFGEDAVGKLYILTAAGGLYRIESN